jgi:hypothetical protein
LSVGLLAIAVAIPLIADAIAESASPEVASGALEVVFREGRLGIEARQVRLDAVAEAVATRTGISISINPELAAIPVTVRFEPRGLNAALRAILQAAGITNSALVFRRSAAPGHRSEWSIERAVWEARAQSAPTEPGTAGASSPTNRGTPGSDAEPYFDPRRARVVDVAPRQVLVRFRAGLSDAQVRVVVREMGARIRQRFARIRFYRLEMEGDGSVEEFVSRNRGRGEIELIEPNAERHGLGTRRRARSRPGT